MHCDGGRRLRLLAALGLASALFSGCKDSQPPPPHYRDLGSDGEILLPTGRPRYAITDPKVGTADWLPFRDLEEEEDKNDEEVDAERTDDAADEGDDESSDNGVENEIRRLVADFAALADEGDTEEMLAYFVEKQQEQVNAIIEGGVALLEKIRAITATLQESAPEASQRVTAGMGPFAGAGGQVISIDSIKAADDQNASATLRGLLLGRSCNFVVIDDEWFMELPGNTDFAALRARIDGLNERFDKWLAELKAGQVSADEILSRIETAAQEIGE